MFCYLYKLIAIKLQCNEHSRFMVKKGIQFSRCSKDSLLSYKV